MMAIGDIFLECFIARARLYEHEVNQYLYSLDDSSDELFFLFRR
jgi:hypothetical protein